MDDTRLWKLADEAYRAYVETMLWANAECGQEDCPNEALGDCEHQMDAHFLWDASDFSADDQAEMQADVEAMIESAGDDFWAYVKAKSAAGFGVDFALTRNHHGAGFWDRGLGELGDRLTALAHPYGSSSVWVSDDGVGLN